MRFRISTLFPLPICVLLLAHCNLFAQDHEDPFSSSPAAKPVATSPVTTATSSPGVDPEDEKLKAFQAGISRFQSEYSAMLKREQVLVSIIEKYEEERKMGRLAESYKDADKALLARIEEYEEVVERFEYKLAELTNQNSYLKKAVEERYETQEKAKEAAKIAIENRNEMHQSLLESLLNSADAGQQELGLTHLIEYSKKDSVDPNELLVVDKPELLKRIGQLANSNVKNVKRLAGQCLFTFKKDMAIQLGVQFSPVWKPLEYVNASEKTIRILQSLEMQVDLVFEDQHLGDLFDMLQRDLKFEIRVSSEVDIADQVSFESREEEIGDSLSTLLNELGLGYVVQDNSMMILQQTNPKLNVSRRYNVRHLFADQVDGAEVVKLLKQAAKNDSVELTTLNDHVISVKATEVDHRLIEKALGAVAQPTGLGKENSPIKFGK